jgi:thiamine-phosphate pyrophosphorylase
MRLSIPKPILYLITRGATTPTSHPGSKEFQDILNLVRAAVDAGVTLIQLREKQLTARTLFDLTERAAEITSGSQTALLVNDRADVARGAGANGVHLATDSLAAELVRRAFGDDFLIGVSTHSSVELEQARDAGADFAVFGPVFETISKAEYGPPLGLESLQDAARSVQPFPVLALGGVTLVNAVECLRAGAAGVAGISVFADVSSLKSVSDTLRFGAR